MSDCSQCGHDMGAEARVKELEAKLAPMYAERNQLRIDLDVAKKGYLQSLKCPEGRLEIKTEAEILDWKAENAKLKGELAHLNILLGELKSERAEMKPIYEDLQKELQGLKEDKFVIRTGYELQQRELSAIKSKLGEVREAIKRLDCAWDGNQEVPYHCWNSINKLNKLLEEK